MSECIVIDLTIPFIVIGIIAILLFGYLIYREWRKSDEVFERLVKGDK